MRLKPPIHALLALGIVLLACTDDSESIERANQAAASESAITTPVPTSSATTPQPGSGTSVFDLRTGDCFINSGSLGDELGDVTTVPCSDPWDFAVLNSFVTNIEDGPYLGAAAFEAEADTRCDLASTTKLFPGVDSWGLGDRTVSCLIISDAYFVPAIGDCFEDELVASERIDCSAPHAFEAYAVADLPNGDYSGSVPSDGAESICLDAFEGYVGRSYDSSALLLAGIPPTQGTWELLGHRTASCYLLTEDGSALTGSMRGSGR